MDWISSWTMKKTWGLVAAAVLVTAGAFYFMGESDDLANYPSKGTQIVAIGDSLVEGVGASSKDRNFVSLLSADIGRPIVNLGISGNTSANVLARIAQLDQYDPQVVILLVGGNDAIRDVPPEATFQNIARIIEEIQKRGAVVVLLGVRGGILSDAYRDRFARLAETYRTAYVEDVMGGIFARSQYLADAIHPNDLGYRMIADKVRPALEEVIR